MRTGDILIEKSVFCIFDMNLPYVNLTNVTLGMEDEQGRFVYQLLVKYFDDIHAKRADYTDEDFLGVTLSKGEDPFDSFLTYAADEIHHLMVDNPEIQQGCGIFVKAVMGEESYIIFLKLNHQAGFICQLDEEGLISWKRNTMLVPPASKKVTEYLYINLSDSTVRVSDYDCYVNGEKVNYLADLICKIRPKKSEKETIEAITDAIAATIEEKYEEEIPQKLIESKKAVAAIVEEKGTIAPEDLKQTVFADNEEAADRYMEKLVEERLPKGPVEVSTKMERRLNRKQKIVTASGIEILVPMEFLQDSSVFEYVQDETGKVCIMIKETGRIV